MKIHNNRIRKLARLQPQDTIGIVAPAWSFDPENFKRGVDTIRKLGFRVKYDRSIFSKYWSLAGFDRERADQINRMFADPQVRAIFCAKAGYGSLRTIPYLDKKIIRRNPKIFIGYSDITMLLVYLYKTAHMPVFHGPVVSDEIYEGMSPVTLDYLLHAVTQTQSLGELRFPYMRTLRHGQARGVLVGGNLSVLVNAIGTPCELDTKGKILYLEDVGEDFEVIDSYLMQMKLAGMFKKVQGIVFGRMTDCVDHSGQRYQMRDILHDVLADLSMPIIYGFPSGHGTPGDINITLPFGVVATLDASIPPRLIIEESAVR